MKPSGRASVARETVRSSSNKPQSGAENVPHHRHRHPGRNLPVRAGRPSPVSSLWLKHPDRQYDIPCMEQRNRRYNAQYRKDTVPYAQYGDLRNLAADRQYDIPLVQQRGHGFYAAHRKIVLHDAWKQQKRGQHTDRSDVFSQFEQRTRNYDPDRELNIHNAAV